MPTCYRKDGCPYPGRPCSMCECGNPNYTNDPILKKYLVVFSYTGRSGDSNCQGIDNKIVYTDKDVFTEEQIRAIEQQIVNDLCYTTLSCSIINIIPLNA